MRFNKLYALPAALALLIGGGTAWGYLKSETPPDTVKVLVIDADTDTGTCEQIDAVTVKLSGSIDDAMKACAVSILTSAIKTVIVTSKGGEVFAGRAIGYKIGEHPRHLIIDGLCLSSCGNYFVPAAAQVTLLPRSVIGLHGTPDPHMLSSVDMETHMASLIEDGHDASEGLTRILKRKSYRRKKQLFEETKFAAHFNVPKGWRLYRDTNDADDGWRRQFTAGSDAGVTPDKFMIAEGPMLASCLPQVKTEDYQAALEETVFDNPALWAALRKDMGAYRSLNLTCHPAIALGPQPQ